LEDPPKRLVISEMSPPSPAILLSPPLNTLASPPEAVCDSTLFQAFPLDDEVGVVLLDGLPNWMLCSFSLEPAERDLSPKDAAAIEPDAVRLVVDDIKG